MAGRRRGKAAGRSELSIRLALLSSVQQSTAALPVRKSVQSFRFHEPHRKRLDSFTSMNFQSCDREIASKPWSTTVHVGHGRPSVAAQVARFVSLRARTPRLSCLPPWAMSSLHVGNASISTNPIDLGPPIYLSISRITLAG